MLVVNPRSAVPPFEQLRVQILELVGNGALAPETRLPTVRKLASDLGVAPNTVARTYRELERAGIIETRGRHGTFVATHGDPAHRQAQKAAAAFADQIRSLKLSRDEALAVVRAALDDD
ncbi:MAG TPA: GntR family transcriptional regulator [Microbacteriaceae bacterium]